MQINSFKLKLTGSFTYDPEHVKNRFSSSSFDYAGFFTNNSKYLSQKYYSNWLNSFYYNDVKLRENRLGVLNSNHLKLHEESELYDQIHAIDCFDGESERSIEFTVESVETFLLREHTGIFIIGIDLLNVHWNWEDISLFTSHIRRTNTFNPEGKLPIIVEIIEQHISGEFHPDKTKWRNFHPQLKSVILVDLKESIPKNQLDRLLYDLGTFSNPLEKHQLLEPEENYYLDEIEANSISVFNNWKALCLEDSLVRVSIDLEDKDKFKLWEREYVYIYIYVLFARHYLYRCNATLIEVSSNEKLLKETRNNFFQFMNEFEFTRISYKFLPNTLFLQFKKSLQIDDEIRIVEKEIARINTLFKEQSDDRLGKVILILTTLTLLSVAYDASHLFIEILSPESNQQRALILSISLILIVGFGAYLLWMFKDRFRK